MFLIISRIIIRIIISISKSEFISTPPFWKCRDNRRVTLFRILFYHSARQMSKVYRICQIIVKKVKKGNKMHKILIIEDDKEIAELERDYLEVNGFGCDIAARGTTGLERALASEYDLIIIDVMLPGMDGFEVITELRKKKQTPVIFLSARGNDIDKIRGLGLGADDYMTKPFSPGELVARVKAHSPP